MKTLRILISTLAFLQGSIAIASPPGASGTIFSGSDIKTLKSNLNLKDAAKLLTGSDDPTSVAKDAPKGSLYLRQGTIGENYVKQDDGSSTNWSIIGVAGGALTTADILLDIVGTPTYTTLDEFIDTTGSAGLTSGGGITDNGDGTIDIAAGTGFFRTTDSRIGHIVSGDWPAITNQALTDNSENYINIDYNSGTPIVTVGTTDTENHHTSNVIALVYREGTTLHINVQAARNVSDVADNVIDRFKKQIGTGHESGVAISETGTRNIAVTSGVMWMGLNHFDTDAFDSSAADTFEYNYQDGGGGWTAVASSTQIDNLQYDDGSGTLATLGNSRYGVHWVYMEVDSDVTVVYGRGSYTSTQAQDTQPPSNNPPHFGNNHAFLIGKIVIGKSDATFTSVDSAFYTVFVGTGATDHNDLANLQGGTSAEYYHTTSAEHTIITQSATTSLSGYLISADWNDFDAKTDPDLSNLTSPTDINQSLIPNSTAIDLGTSSKNYGSLFFEDANVYNAGSSRLSLTAQAGSSTISSVGDNIDLLVNSADYTGALAFYTGLVELKTGDITNGSATGNTGDINIETGANSGSGDRGSILLVDGTEGTVGEYWVSSSTGGKGNWEPLPVLNTDTYAAGNADYTILDGDGYKNILSGTTTLTANRTITLPTASANTDRVIVIKKVDTSAFTVTIDGEGAETIDGETTIVMADEFESVTLICDGTEWHTITFGLATADKMGLVPLYETGTWTPTVQAASGNYSSVTYDFQVGEYTKVGNLVIITCYLQFYSATGGTGAMLIQGLPFTSTSLSNSYSSIAIEGDDINYSGTGLTSLFGRISPSSTQMSLIVTMDNAAAGTLQASDNTGTTVRHFIFSGTYLTD